MAKKKRTSFALSEDTLKKLKQLAEREGRSMANMIETIVMRVFEELTTHKKS